MIRFLTTNPLVRGIGKLIELIRKGIDKVSSRGDNRGLAFKGLLGALIVGLGILFLGTVREYQEAAQQLKLGTQEGDPTDIPSIFPLVWQSIGVFFSLVAFFVSLWIRPDTKQSRREYLTIIALALAAVAALASWLPIDVIETKAAISGKATAGELPSIPAYLGKLLLISLLILSVPVIAISYFRLGLMDRYVVHSVLSPISFCLVSFIAIWIIADFSDNGPLFAGQPMGVVFEFYVVQAPFVVLFVMPIVMLLSGLSALSKMSKSNELISMIGAGRSVFRILAPVFIVGVYASLICLAFKYEWAPRSVGYKEAMLQTLGEEAWSRSTGKEIHKDLWAKRGWMHVNEVDDRTWFVGKVPYRLSDEMADIVIWQIGEDGFPDMIWKAKRARWLWDAQPEKWVFSSVQIYKYDAEHIPRIEQVETLEVDGWRETPWKVLSSSQNPEFLGLPGLAAYLNANADMESGRLAPFQTNWWYIFAEPVNCLALIMVAAPLGIVYSRRGVMGGVTGAIIIFAAMYILRGTLLALGHRGDMAPFFAAWGTNFFVMGIGCVLLWFRARNREVPKVRTLVSGLLRRKSPTQS